MSYDKVMLQSARNHAHEILISADTIQEMVIALPADNLIKRNMITAAKQIRLNACRILATSDEPAGMVTLKPSQDQDSQPEKEAAELPPQEAA